jgi:Ras GTPase-activating protein-binding protein 2
MSAAPATELEAEPVKELASEDVDAVVAKVDEELERGAEKDSSAEETNGHLSAVEEPTTADHESLNDVAAAGAESEQKTEAENVVSDSSAQVELPKEPAPTPAVPETKPTPKVAAVPTPPKPAVPKTWAQLAGGTSASTSNVAPPASTAATPAVKPATATPSNNVSSATAATVTASTPKRLPSPTDSNQDGSSGGWQTAGADHSRNKSRSHTGPTLGENGTVRAYVKNVYQDVSTDALRAELSKYGELSYFDISRQKVSDWPSSSLAMLTID